MKQKQFSKEILMVNGQYIIIQNDNKERIYKLKRPFVYANFIPGGADLFPMTDTLKGRLIIFYHTDGVISLCVSLNNTNEKYDSYRVYGCFDDQIIPASDLIRTSYSKVVQELL